MWSWSTYRWRQKAEMWHDRSATILSALPAMSPIPPRPGGLRQGSSTGYGGVDIVVSNAGAAWESPIATMDDALLRKSFELNFFAHQCVAQNAVRIMKAQGTGGAFCYSTQQTGHQSRRQFRRLRPAEGRHAVPVAAVCAGAWQGRHPRQCGQCRPYPLGSAQRRDDRQPLDGTRPVGQRNTWPATCCISKSMQTMWRRLSCIMRWLSAPRPT
jgi:NAD(P)-dependent dehydrogenase (short-subunit alcohol dehydrogenase family)